MNNKGFTLLEILVAISIFAAITAMLYPTYRGTFRNVETAESQSEIYQMARITIERLTDDLQSSYLPQGPKNKQIGEEAFEPGDFLGQDSTINERDADTLRFFSEEHIIFNENEKHGRGRIAYYVKEREGKDTLILYRSDNLESSNRSEEFGGGFVLCDKLYSINFTFYDENGESHDNWDSSIEPFKDKLPSRVSIDLKLGGQSGSGSPISFMTSIFIPLARSKYDVNP
jgi:general secretion pathway protein J